MSNQVNLLSSLKSYYPNVPITTILKVMNKCDDDEERCRHALDEENMKYQSTTEDGVADFSSGNANNSSNLGVNQNEVKSVTGHMQELHVSHESSQRPQERHVSTIERSVGVNRTDPKRPIISQSVSLTVQTPDSQHVSTSKPSGQGSIPQTAPVDLNSFIFNSSPSDIPSIDCKTHGSTLGSANAHRPRQVPISNSTSSPSEQRRPVKVITIPPGSLSGGSVSPAGVPQNSRHIRMHFGDTGGVCTVTAPPNTSVRHYGPSVGQTFRREILAESSGSPQTSMHSSSIVVNTANLANHSADARKLNNGRRTPNPPPFSSGSANNSPMDQLPPSQFGQGKPFSTPVQVSSPGISHSKPVFVAIKREQPPSSSAGGAGYNDVNFIVGGGSGVPMTAHPNSVVTTYPLQMPYGPPSSTSYMSQYNMDYPSGTYLGHQEQQYPTGLHHPGYRGNPSSNHPYLPSSSSGYDPNAYPQPPAPHLPFSFSPAMPHLSHYSPHYNQFHMPPSSSSQSPLMGARSNSQDSDASVVGASPEFVDSRLANHYSTMGSRVSSQSSVSSDSSGRTAEQPTPTRPRSGSMQDEADYIRALLQHQRSRMQKLAEDKEKHQEILENLRHEVGQLEMNMIENGNSKSFPSVEDIAHLWEKNRLLQTEIQMKMNEIEMYKSGQIPFNKMTPAGQQNFFENMPTGQQDPIYSRRSPDGGFRDPTSVRPIPPPRPPPPIPVRQRSTEPQASGATGSTQSLNEMFNRVLPVPPTQPTINSGDSEEGDSWNCTACTFSNHPALQKCEMCEMPRAKPPASTPPVLPPHQPLTALPPRLAPGIVSTARSRSGSPSSLGHQHQHRAGT